MDSRFNAHIHKLEKTSYINDEAESPPEGLIIDCSLGINPYGCSPAVRKAMARVPSSYITSYPAYPYESLTREISEYWRCTVDLPEGCVRLGNGANGILNQVNKLFINTDSKVLGFCPQFSDYMNFVHSYGGRCEFYKLPPANLYAFDVKDFLEHITSNYTIVYVDNPSNPTGQVIPVQQIKEIVHRARRMNAYAIVDEAYGEYMPAANSAVTLVGEFDNLFVVRSFSKGFGMAGLRVGYFVACKRMVEFYKRIEIPFSVNRFGEIAASAALADKVFIEDSTRRIGKDKAKLMQSCRKLICSVTDPHTSILVLSHPDGASDLHDLFLRHGVLTEAGDGFVGLTRSAVRLRVPRDVKLLVDKIMDVESEIT